MEASSPLGWGSKQPADPEVGGGGRDRHQSLHKLRCLWKRGCSSDDELEGSSSILSSTPMTWNGAKASTGTPPHRVAGSGLLLWGGVLCLADPTKPHAAGTASFGALWAGAAPVRGWGLGRRLQNPGPPPPRQCSGGGCLGLRPPKPPPRVVTLKMLICSCLWLQKRGETKSSRRGWWRSSSSGTKGSGARL